MADTTTTNGSTHTNRINGEVTAPKGRVSTNREWDAEQALRDPAGFIFAHGVRGTCKTNVRLATDTGSVACQLVGDYDGTPEGLAALALEQEGLIKCKRAAEQLSSRVRVTRAIDAQPTLIAFAIDPASVE